MIRRLSLGAALFAGAVFSLAMPAAAQTATPAPAVTPPVAATPTPAPRMTSAMRVRGVGLVPEMGRCRGCGEQATARRGTYNLQMPCPGDLMLSPFGTCVRMP